MLIALALYPDFLKLVVSDSNAIKTRIEAEGTRINKQAPKTLLTNASKSNLSLFMAILIIKNETTK
jgi:hypothetical protein